MDEKEVRILGYCVECGNEIDDSAEQYFITEEGEALCSESCLLDHYCIHIVEV